MAKVALPPSLVSLVEGTDVVVWVGSASAGGRPSTTRATLGRVLPGGASFSVGLVRATAGRLLADVAESPRVAVTFTRPADFVSYQLKGRVIGVEEATGAERRAAERYREHLLDVLVSIGFERGAAARTRLTPDLQLQIALEDVFRQTPGPLAGAAVEA